MKHTFYLLAFLFISLTSAQSNLNLDDGFMAEGYDVVSYFNDKAEEGLNKYTYSYNGAKYKFSLQEHLTTFNALDNKNSSSSDHMAFLIKIDQFNIQNSTNDVNTQNTFIIPNECTTDAEVKIHKGKKMNFICSINPTKLKKISGSITALDKGVAFAASGRFILELVIIPRKDN